MQCLLPQLPLCKPCSLLLCPIHHTPPNYTFSCTYPPLLLIPLLQYPHAQVALTAVSLVSKVAYSYDLGAWTFLEGMMSARNHPNMLLWNVTRFNPFYCLLEVCTCVR